MCVCVCVCVARARARVYVHNKNNALSVHKKHNDALSAHARTQIQNKVSKTMDVGFSFVKRGFLFVLFLFLFVCLFVFCLSCTLKL